MFAATLALLMQVGPNPSVGGMAATPPELEELRARQSASQATASMPASRLNACIARADIDPVAARKEAEDWLGRADGIDLVHASHCRGYALSALGIWGEAGRSFVAARDSVPIGNFTYRAQLGAMAANAWLAAGDNRRALDTVELAATDAFEGGEPLLQAELLSDKARALVGLQRQEEAAAALATARQLAPWNARIWLLSATLARRSDDLAAAQQLIEQAGVLGPTDPQIGLEAGVIAVLSGNDDAARQSWQSVIALDGDTEQAATARSYLAQLDE